MSLRISVFRTRASAEPPTARSSSQFWVDIDKLGQLSILAFEKLCVERGSTAGEFGLHLLKKSGPHIGKLGVAYLVTGTKDKRG